MSVTTDALLASMIDVVVGTRTTALAAAQTMVTGYLEAQSLILSTDSERFKLAVAITANNNLRNKMNSRVEGKQDTPAMLTQEVKNLLDTEDETNLIDFSSDNPNSDSSFHWSS